MGNSEVGHMNLGTGRVIYQDFTRVSRAIDEGRFDTNEVLVSACRQAKDQGGTLHVLGLLSPGGVHSHEDHIEAMIGLADTLNVPMTRLHAFLDGRDMPPSPPKIYDSFPKIGDRSHQLQILKSMRSLLRDGPR